MHIREILVSALVSGLLTACSFSINEEELVAEAKAEIARGDYQTAVVKLMSVLQHNGNSMEARWLLGVQHLEEGNYASAKKELERAQKLGVAAASVTVPLIQATLRLGAFDEVVAFSDAGLPKDVASEVRAAKVAAYLGKQQSDKARALLSSALAEDPQSLPLAVEEARVMLGEGNVDSARAKLLEILQHAPEYYVAWRLLGEVEKQAGNLEQAESALTKVIDNRRDNLTVLIKRAFVRLGMGHDSGALDDVAQFRKKNPNYFEADHVEGVVLYRQERYAEAAEVLSKSVNSNPGYLPALSYLGLALMHQGQFELAARHLEKVVVLAPASVQARESLARAKLELKQYQDVLSLLQPVVRELPDDIQALALLANAYIAMGALTDAMPLAEQLVKLKPDVVGYRVTFASVLNGSGSSEGAIEQLQIARNLDPLDVAATRDLVGTLLVVDRYEEAEAVASEYRSAVPTSPFGYVLNAAVAAAKKDLSTAEDQFSKALELEPTNLTAGLGIARLVAGKGDYTRARRILNNLRAVHRDELSLYLELATLAKIEGDDDEFVSIMQQAISAHSGSVALKVALARFFVERKDSRNAMSAVSGLQGPQADDPRVLEVLAWAQLLGGDGENALVTARRLVDQRPDSGPAQFLLGWAYGRSGDLKRAQQALLRSVDLDAGYFVARLHLARVLLASGDYISARTQVQTLKSRAPDNADVAELERLLHQTKFATADSMPQTTYNDAQSRATGVLSVVRQRWMAGEQRAALTLLEREHQATPDDRTLLRSLADAQLLLGDERAASDSYLLLLDLAPDDVDALNNAAWLLRDSNVEQATRLSARAFELAPRSVNVLDTAAMVSLASGRFEKAKTYVDAAHSLDPTNPTIRLHRAIVLHSAGEKQQALGDIKALLAEGNDFPQREYAQRLLKEWLSGS